MQCNFSCAVFRRLRLFWSKSVFFNRLLVKDTTHIILVSSEYNTQRDSDFGIKLSHLCRMTIIDRFIYKNAMVLIASINKKRRRGSACVSNLRDLSHYTAKKTAYTMGAAPCSVKPDAADLHTALYRQSVHVVFLDSVPEVAEMATIHGNLHINIYFF